jgi:predicted TPR repeat methyltransferase
MKPLQASSGDLLVDRRADYAQMLHAAGDHAAAAELMRGALDLAPDWALGWFRLGEMLETAGLLDGAAEAWTTSLKRDPSDRAGAALRLELIGRALPGKTLPSAFVEALFDQYADTFDASLVGRLEYRIPDLLDRAIRAAAQRPFRLAIDLGCGTGLMGERLRPISGRLEGYDISAGMLRKAREKGVYDLLARADLRDFSRGGENPDLVTAADVFMYVGALDGIFAAVAAMLDRDGLFAFSVETASSGVDFALQPSRRYAHCEAYVRRMLAARGLQALSLSREIIRRDRGQPVEGLIVVAAFSVGRQ